MPVTIPADYFLTGVWAEAGPLRLRSFTCLECGHHSASWEAFRVHRLTCDGHLEGHAPRVAPEAQGLAVLALCDADRAALDALRSQLPEVA